MALHGEMLLCIWNVEHGACAMLHHHLNGYAGRLAMIDSGSSHPWWPSTHITRAFGRNRLDYLFITNADQDHMSDLQGLWDAGIEIPVLFRSPHAGGPETDVLRKHSTLQEAHRHQAPFVDWPPKRMLLYRFGLNDSKKGERDESGSQGRLGFNHRDDNRY